MPEGRKLSTWVMCGVLRGGTNIQDDGLHLEPVT